MVEIEFHQLEQPYKKLRITKESNRRRLLSSLAADGQQTPVLVVAKNKDSYVLIDGHKRVSALKELGRDTVDAVVLQLSESSALILKHQQERAKGGSALEEAWMMQVLVEQHGFKQQELATRLGQSQSWVSRRFALIKTLPLSVQQLVREGQLSSYLASKYFVPMARAIKSDCEKLAQNLGGHALSTRQMEGLYKSWRSSDRAGKKRIVDQPLLFLKTIEELEQSQPPVPDAKGLLKDLSTVDSICRRIVDRFFRHPMELEMPKELIEIWTGTQRSIDALTELMNEKIDN